MNIELLDSDATSCSVTGSNCDFAHMTGCFLMKVYHCSVEVRDLFFDQTDTTLVSFVWVYFDILLLIAMPFQLHSQNLTELILKFSPDIVHLLTD